MPLTSHTMLWTKYFLSVGQVPSRFWYQSQRRSLRNFWLKQGKVPSAIQPQRVYQNKLETCSWKSNKGTKREVSTNILNRVLPIPMPQLCTQTYGVGGWLNNIFIFNQKGLKSLLLEYEIYVSGGERRGFQKGCLSSWKLNMKASRELRKE